MKFSLDEVLSAPYTPNNFVVSGFGREAFDKCAFLGYYAANSANNLRLVVTGIFYELVSRGGKQVTG